MQPQSTGVINRLCMEILGILRAMVNDLRRMKLLKYGETFSL
jgi:hypothetical protein